MAANLSSLLTASKALNSHLAKPDLPAVNLSLDQIEAQSRRLVSRQTGTGDDGRAYVLTYLYTDYAFCESDEVHARIATTCWPKRMWMRPH